MELIRISKFDHLGRLRLGVECFDRIGGLAGVGGEYASGEKKMLSGDYLGKYHLPPLQKVGWVRDLPGLAQVRWHWCPQAVALTTLNAGRGGQINWKL